MVDPGVFQMNERKPKVRALIIAERASAIELIHRFYVYCFRLGARRSWTDEKHVCPPNLKTPADLFKVAILPLPQYNIHIF
jgi:hypothetical protein